VPLAVNETRVYTIEGKTWRVRNLGENTGPDGHARSAMLTYEQLDENGQPVPYIFNDEPFLQERDGTIYTVTTKILPDGGELEVDCGDCSGTLPTGEKYTYTIDTVREDTSFTVVRTWEEADVSADASGGGADGGTGDGTPPGGSGRPPGGAGDPPDQPDDPADQPDDAPDPGDLSPSGQDRKRTAIVTPGQYRIAKLGGSVPAGGAVVGAVPVWFEVAASVYVVPVELGYSRINLKLSASPTPVGVGLPSSEYTDRAPAVGAGAELFVGGSAGTGNKLTAVLRVGSPGTRPQVVELSVPAMEALAVLQGARNPIEFARASADLIATLKPWLGANASVDVTFVVDDALAQRLVRDDQLTRRMRDAFSDDNLTWPPPARPDPIPIEQQYDPPPTTDLQRWFDDPAGPVPGSAERPPDPDGPATGDEPTPQ